MYTCIVLELVCCILKTSLQISLDVCRYRVGFLFSVAEYLISMMRKVDVTLMANFDYKKCTKKNLTLYTL